MLDGRQNSIDFQGGMKNDNGTKKRDNKMNNKRDSIKIEKQ